MNKMCSERKDIVCRVCLRIDGDTTKCISLFENYKDSTICSNIISIANVSIEKDDGFPTKICPECLLELETAINFKQKCETSNIILQGTNLENLHKDDDYDLLIVKKEEPQEEEDEPLYEALCDLDELETDCLDLDVKETKPFKSKAIDLKLECHDCGGSFKSKCKLRVHWKKVHMYEKLICQTCKRSFKSYRAFNRHMKHKSKSCISTAKMHVEGLGKSRVFHCKDCYYTSRRVKDMQSHIVVHSGERPYVCTICSKAYGQQSSLQNHQEVAHGRFKKEITCQYCGTYIKGRRKVYKHLLQHKEQFVQCDICKKMLKSKNSLKSHLQRHTGIKSYTCEKCAATFYTLSELCNHKRCSHVRIWYKCDLCDYKALRNATLKNHKSKHTNTNVACVVCGLFLENQQKWEAHCQKRHSDVNKYPCPECNLKYCRRDSLSKHIRKKHRCSTTIAKKPIKKEIAMLNLYDEIIEVSPVSVV